MSRRRQGRRPRLTTPLSGARMAAVRALSRPFNRLSPLARFLVGFLALTLLTTLLLAWTRSQMPADVYQEGDVVRSDVIAPADITAVDEEETKRRRAQAAESAPPVWGYDPTRAESAAQSFRNSWETLKRQYDAAAAATPIQRRGGVAGDGAPNYSGRRGQPQRSRAPSSRTASTPGLRAAHQHHPRVGQGYVTTTPRRPPAQGAARR